MAGSWLTFTAPDTSTGPFGADIMMLLTDGSVLIHNGFSTNSNLANARQWLRLTPGADGKYENGTWSPEFNMTYARQWFASGVLADGRVFAIGGEYSDDPPDHLLGNPSDSLTGEVFDPLTNQWSLLNKPPAFDFVRGDCNGTVLAGGRVLLGGASLTQPPSTWSTRTAIWNPYDDSWTQAGLEFGDASATTKADPPEEESWTLLPDGSVLAPSVRDTPTAQRYVPSLDKWVDCSPSPVKLALTELEIKNTGVYEIGPNILLPSGKVFVIGGTGQTAIFSPGPGPADPGQWAVGPTFPADTSAKPLWQTLTALDSTACLLPNGRVVLMAGTTAPDSGDYFSNNPVFLVYDPKAARNTLPALDPQPPNFPSTNFVYQSSLLLLPTGQMLCSAQTDTLFLYTPDPADGLPDPAWKPGNISVPTALIRGNSYKLFGTQINGLSQAVCYGDDGGMATNYPIVRLTHTTTHEVAYIRSHDFSSMGVATGTVVPRDLKSCTIDIPANLSVGKWNLVVIANGIPSDAVTVAVTDS